MGKVVRLLKELKPALHRCIGITTIQEHAACTAVERCQAGGLGQVVASTMPRAQKEEEKGLTVSNDDKLCLSSSY